MKDAIEKQLGPKRRSNLIARFRGETIYDDHVEQAMIAARGREMTERQREVFATISLLRAAGVRPSESDIEAWHKASDASEAAAKQAPEKPKTKKGRKAA